MIGSNAFRRIFLFKLKFVKIFYKNFFSDMIKADQALTDETERLQDELDKTNKNLDDEVTRGQLRDATLNDHNVRITVLRNDVDKNTADLVTTNEELDQKTQKLTDDLRNTTDTLNDRIYETDR